MTTRTPLAAAASVSSRPSAYVPLATPEAANLNASPVPDTARGLARTSSRRQQPTHRGPSSGADPMLRPAGSSRPVACSGTEKRPTQWTRGCLAAMSRVRVFAAALRGKCREFSAAVRTFIAGDVTFELVEGRWHEECREIHVEGACSGRRLHALCGEYHVPDECTRTVIGLCEACKAWRTLTDIGLCPTQSGHRILERHFKSHLLAVTPIPTRGGDL